VAAVIAFLDASALIYLLEGEPPWASAVKHELQALADGHPQLAIALSRLSVLECRVGPLRRGDQSSLERLDGFFARRDLLWQELSPAVVEQAITLRAHHGLRTPDALQAACCLQRPWGGRGWRAGRCRESSPCGQRKRFWLQGGPPWLPDHAGGRN
jgi:predicted nucleic acid-binding protein